MQWRKVPDFEYEVSEAGDVRRIGKHKNLKVWVRKSRCRPYLAVDLYKSGRKCRYCLHRLVAEVWLPNPDNLPEVNHKDRNTLHCAVSNLEWINRSDNVRHHIEADKHPFNVHCDDHGWMPITEEQFNISYSVSSYPCPVCGRDSEFDNSTYNEVFS